MTLIAELESIEIITVLRHEELMEEVKNGRAEEVNVWKVITDESVDSLIDDVNVVKFYIVKTDVKLKLILARFEENVRALQPTVNANVERKVTITNAMGKVRELRECGRSVDQSDYSVEISKLTREVPH